MGYGRGRKLRRHPFLGGGQDEQILMFLFLLAFALVLSNLQDPRQIVFSFPSF